MIITKTPLRISLFGGGTDLKEYYKTGHGSVLNMSIDKYIYIIVNPKFDNSIRVSYSKTEIVDKVEDLQHPIVKECLQMVGITNGIEIISIADIPAGTGLGSSSCFTVGLLNALYTYTGRTLSSEELAKKACEIEINILKNPIGKQDQYACACGGINYFRFNQDESVIREQLRLDDMRLLNRKLMMFYTGNTRSANKILAEQTNNTKAKLTTLHLMRKQADEMKDDIQINGITSRIGEELHNGWLLKKGLASGISNPVIDGAYQRAIDAGAIGGKLLGAGGGGFILVYCDEDKQNNVRTEIALPEVEFKISQYGSRVIYSE
jgi:D-glycero-alpha-D-manno-heptose-7-phosphate kinase